MKTARRLCQLTDVPDGHSKGFEIEGQAIFVVHQRGRVFAYRNVCPHLSVPMEWQPDEFLDSDKRMIQCAVHGALFLIESGYCVSGPCTGQSLTTVPCEVRGDDIWVTHDPD